MCRECIRKEGWEEKVSLQRIANHYIFTVESTGCIPPIELIKEVSRGEVMWIYCHVRLAINMDVYLKIDILSQMTDFSWTSIPVCMCMCMCTGN